MIDGLWRVGGSLVVRKYYVLSGLTGDYQLQPCVIELKYLKERGFVMPKKQSGLCHYCNVLFTWKGEPKLDLAWCPECSHKLWPVPHSWMGQKSGTRPVTLEARKYVPDARD